MRHDPFAILELGIETGEAEAPFPDRVGRLLDSFAMDAPSRFNADHGIEHFFVGQAVMNAFDNALVLLAVIDDIQGVAYAQRAKFSGDRETQCLDLILGLQIG